MKYILSTLLFFASISWSSKIFAQSYTTESKSCGSCGKSVSVNSRIGMYCPHCNVRWGYENQSKRTTNRNSYDTNDSYTKASGVTSSNVNLRESPSTRSSILAVVPAYATVAIISTRGNWYY